VKFVAEVAAPPVVITVIGPEVAKSGTLTVICVSEFAWKLPLGDAIPLNNTDVTPLKCVPVMRTVASGEALVGVKPTIDGAGATVTVKVLALVILPPGAMTVIFPVVAP
jgi:hypothetical protein